MSFQGNLASVAFPDILQLLTLSKKTGTLTLRSGKIEKKVFFKNGTIIYASSNLAEDSFESQILSAGNISLEDLQKSKKVQELTGKDLPSTIVYLGLIDKDKVAELARKHVESIVFSLFSWEEGEFIFEENVLPDTDVIVSSLNTMNILMEGTRRIDEWTRIRNALPQPTSVLQVAGEVLAQMKEIKISPQEALVLSLVNGEWSVEEMEEKSGLDKLTFAKALYNLISAGVVKKIGVKESKKKVVDEMKTALQVMEALYNISFDVIYDHILQKIGKSSSKIIKATHEKESKKYKVLSFLTVNDDGTINFTNFLDMCNNLPPENRIHEVSSGLSSFLAQLLLSAQGTVGAKQKQVIVEKINSALESIVKENKQILEKYGIISDITRALQS